MTGQDLSQLPMIELFRIDAESQTQLLTEGLLALEREPTAADQLEICMRAAHSLKGGARIIDFTPGVDLTHAMEECFVAAQQGRLILNQEQIDVLLRGVDLLLSLTRMEDQGSGPQHPEVNAFLLALEQALAGQVAAVPAPTPIIIPTSFPEPLRDDLPAHDELPGARHAPSPIGAIPPPEHEDHLVAPRNLSRLGAGPAGGDRMLRVTADSLNRLLGLAGESLMEARRLRSFADGLIHLKRLHADVAKSFDDLRGAVSGVTTGDDRLQIALGDLRHRIMAGQEFLAHRLDEFDTFDRRANNLAHRFYDEALASRMRPFDDGVRRFARIVRDLGRSLGKQVRLEIVGGTTSVDRDILEQLDAPLGHLLRNAVDHGIEAPEDRLTLGKPIEGVIRLEARHRAGMLQIIVQDDGAGVDLNKIRAAIHERNLTNDEIIGRLSEAELLEFLFLPGFTMKTTVTEISGRGVGLDAVQAAVKQVRGIVRVTAQPGRGMRFQLQLPLTLSVVRTLLVEIGGEPYAFPLAGITRTLKLPRERIELIEGRQHFSAEDRQIGLIMGYQVLEGREPAETEEDIPVVVVGNQHHIYGLVVDRFLGERELVVQPLDERLGKIAGISAAAVMEDGAPVLIVDVEDMIRSVDKLTSSGRLDKLEQRPVGAESKRRKRILVVDDSLTVRELERKLLNHHGYEVDVAVDGMDGWNAVRTGSFDLVVTDIDMPRMDGIELVSHMKKDPHLRALPIMIVSYKDREQDRQRGLDAGADYYLTKGSFHDETLLQAVIDLIGEAV